VAEKVFIIGFDGASYDLIEKWASAGILPNFKKVMSEGVYGPLRTTIPPLTPCAWNSMVTGNNPGKHGVYDFTRLDENGSLKFNNSSQVRSPKIWNYLDRKDLKSLVFNVPFTYPASKINGIMITDFTTPSIDSEFTYPQDLKSHILDNYKDFRISEGVRYSENMADKLSYLKSCFDTDNVKLSILTDLLKKERYDFVMFTFMFIDHIQHFYWKYMDESHPFYEHDDNLSSSIMDAYKRADEILGTLMEAYKEYNFIVVSDHGAGPYFMDISMNKWLADNGYLFFKKSRNPLKMITNAIGIDFFVSKLVNLGLLNKLKKISFLKKTFAMSYEDIDWKRTKAYSFGYYAPIYLNKKLIETEEEKKRTEDDIIDGLNKIEDPFSKQPIIKQIWKKSDLYSGSMVGSLPDIIMNIGDFAYCSSSEMVMSSNQLFSKPKTFKSGDHRMNGIFMAYGPDFKKGTNVKDANIIDIAPTVLHMFGIQIPGDVDGKVLKHAFKSESHAEKSVDLEQAEASYTSTTKEEENFLKQRLKDLGYLG